MRQTASNNITTQHNGMAESLNDIALISGGKDSFYSLLHCLQNGHKVVALGNLFPGPDVAGTTPATKASNQNQEIEDEEEHDLNSFMYQTVGHTVIPLYEQALGIPLYRQQIIGTAVQTGTSYGHLPSKSPGADEKPPKEESEDETESLIPLLQRIMKAHPEANALSTGAILSTYQRTRIESVALRLGLIPLAYLWQYPILPPKTQSSLLQDMRGVGLDARIVKVASGGLDESFLWENVTEEGTIRRVEKAMRRFGTDGDGAVLGEGGEFETLVVDGPGYLFKGRIVVQEEDRKIIREGGGSAWLKIRKASVVMKDEEVVIVKECRVPDLLEARLSDILNKLSGDVKDITTEDIDIGGQAYAQGLREVPTGWSQSSVDHHIFTVEKEDPDLNISQAALRAIEEIQKQLYKRNLKPTDIISTLVILRSMQDFASVNKIYGSLFTTPNPPSRVTIACGDLLPPNTSLVIQLRTTKASSTPILRQALHVQSRSYWAPANIGPYSQAITTPISTSRIEDTDALILGSYIAGQIPLVPHSMVLPVPTSSSGSPGEGFKMQVVLALQHLVRIALEMRVGWFVSTVAYLPRCTDKSQAQHHATLAYKAWTLLHNPSTTTSSSHADSDTTRDLWEEKFFAGNATYGSSIQERKLPDLSLLAIPNSAASLEDDDEDRDETRRVVVPPFFAAEVAELPRGSMVEWHASLGVVGGRERCVELRMFSSPTTEEGKYTIHQTTLGATIHTLVTIPWNDSSTTRRLALNNAMEALGIEKGIGSEWRSHIAYIDVEAIELGKEDWIGECVVPCGSIWGLVVERDGEGGKEGIGRVAAVLGFEWGVE